MTQASSVSKQISSSISSTVPIKTTATIAGGALKQSNSGSSQLSNVPTVVAKKGPVAPVFGSKKPTTVALTEVKATLETSPTVMPFSLPTESSQQTSKELDHENTPLTDSISITTTVSTDTISTNDQVKLKSVLSNPPIRIGHVSSPEVEAHIDPPLVVNVPATAANFSPAKLSPNKISPIKSPQAERQYELDDELVIFCIENYFKLILMFYSIEVILELMTMMKLRTKKRNLSLIGLVEFLLKKLFKDNLV